MSDKEVLISEKASTEGNYCEVCGIEVNSGTNLKRFGKLFCSNEHMDQYVKARQHKMGLIEESDRDEDEYRTERRRSRSRWGGCG